MPNPLKLNQKGLPAGQAGYIEVILFLLFIMLFGLYSFKPLGSAQPTTTPIQDYGCQAYTGPEVIIPTQNPEFGDIKWILTSVYLTANNLKRKNNTFLYALDNKSTLEVDPTPQIIN